MESIRISWSSVRNFIDCPQRAYRTLQRKRLKITDERIFLPGNVTDRVVRAWLMDETRQPGQMPDMVSTYLQKQVSEATLIKWKGPEAEERNKIEKECIEAVTKIEPDLARYVLPFKVRPDFRFEAPMLAARDDGGEPIPVTLNGIMDIHVHDEERDHYYVFDVKHTRNNSYWQKTGGQIRFYSAANELLFGKPARAGALFQPLATPTFRPISLADADVDDLFQIVTRMANGIAKADMPPRKDTKMCGFCDVKHACDKWKGEPGEKKGSRKFSLGGTLDLT